MKVETIKHILRYVDKANIVLKNEYWEEVMYDKELHWIQLNEEDCFDIYISLEEHNCYCLFYKNVLSIEVIE